MSDPFKTDGPTCISFSGGRTSGYMLWRVLDANGGTLPDDCIVTFANTGLEAEETLEFVRDCETHWGVPIHWVEYRNDEAGFALVDFDSVSRGGSPLRRSSKSATTCPTRSRGSAPANSRSGRCTSTSAALGGWRCGPMGGTR